MGSMANVEKKRFVDPAWPTHLPEGEHAVTEMTSYLAGPSSQYGDDMVFPVPQEQLNYVHPYTRMTR